MQPTGILYPHTDWSNLESILWTNVYFLLQTSTMYGLAWCKNNYEYNLYSKSKNKDWSNCVRSIPGVSLRNWMDHINNSAITCFSYLRYVPVQCAAKFILLLMMWCNDKSVHATSSCRKGFKAHCILQHSSYMWSTGWQPRGTWRKW